MRRKSNKEKCKKSFSERFWNGFFWVVVLIMLNVLIFAGLSTEFFIDSDNFKKYNIFYNNEAVVFRDNDGHKIEPIIDDGIVYVPIVEKGLFLDKTVGIQDGSIHLNDIEMDNVVDINCETISGSTFTNDDVAIYDYTIILNWATWCSDCDELLSNLSKDVEFLKSNNIQLVGLLMDDYENTDFVSKKVNKKMIRYGLEFENLIPNNELSNNFQTNIISIPNVYILDKYSRVVESIILEEKPFYDVIERVLKIKEDSCGEC